MNRTQSGDAADDTPVPTAALQRLDAALEPREYATTLTTGPGRTSLCVTSRHAQIGDRPRHADPSPDQDFGHP